MNLIKLIAEKIVVEKLTAADILAVIGKDSPKRIPYDGSE